MKHERLDAVQGLRALAALLVVVAHSIISLVEKAGLDPAYQTYAWSSGEIGVRIFFAISGFVMVYTSADSFLKNGASPRFLFRRIVRVIPLYYLTTLVYLAKLALQHQAPGARAIALSLLFVPYVNANGLFQPVYGLGWTLNYEMFFYSCFSAMLLLRFRTGVAAIGIGLVTLVLAGLHIRTIGEGGFFWQWLTFASDPIMLYFVIGVIISCVRIQTRVSLTSWPVSATLFLCGLMSLLVIAGHRDGRLSFSMVMAAAGCVALAGLRTSTPNDDLNSLSVRVIRRLGDASYSIYLTHSFLIGPAARAWGSRHGALNSEWPLFVVGMVIGASLLGLLTYRFVEHPMVELLRRWRVRVTYRTPMDPSVSCA
jgi:exopolysaccharide production protein ExoZ